MSGFRDGTEDRRQLQALGEYFARKARGEIRDVPPPQPPGFCWGFDPATRAKLEAERAARGQKNAPPPPTGPQAL